MPLDRKPSEPFTPKLILAFMPATVGKITVKKGQKVKEGEELLIFTAMKMDNRILAPMDGKVKSVNARTGESVPKNTILLELE